MQGEVWRRSKLLVASLLAEVEERGSMRLPELVTFGRELVDPESGRPVWSEKTVLNTVRDLADFGAVRLTMPAAGSRDRLVSLTVLGVAWLDQDLLPLHSAPEGALRKSMAVLLLGRSDCEGCAGMENDHLCAEHDR